MAFIFGFTEGVNMRLEPMTAMWFRKKSKVLREPLYTLPEIADKLEMEHNALIKYMKGRKERPPKPIVGPKADLAGKQNLYRLSEFKTWFKHLGETK
jgi:hypothetical protein